ncbi:hypothetical protein VP01_8994g1, partial [Puccinia sorghi]
FVFYQFMDSAKRELWRSICHWAPYVYQKSTLNLKEYLKEPSQKIDIFLHHVIKMSLQWVNKPKFLMLIHLPHSIRQFAYCEKASVHSNRHRPGHYLAITFANHECMQAVLSDMFKAPIIKQSMVYNEDIDKLKVYPQKSHQKLDSASKLPTPKNLQESYPKKN